MCPTTALTHTTHGPHKSEYSHEGAEASFRRQRHHRNKAGRQHEIRVVEGCGHRPVTVLNLHLRGAPLIGKTEPLISLILADQRGILHLTRRQNLKPTGGFRLSNTAARRGIALQNDRGFGVKQLFHAPLARLDLAGGHLDRRRAGEPRVVGDVVGAEGFFDEIRVVLLPESV